MGRKKISNVEQGIFNDMSIQDLNNQYLEHGYFVECEDGQAGVIGRDIVVKKSC